jgi:hypothetical protein
VNPHAETTAPRLYPGLLDEPGGQRQLLVGVDDVLAQGPRQAWWISGGFLVDFWWISGWFSWRVFNPLTFSMWLTRRLVGLKQQRPKQGSVLGGVDDVAACGSGWWAWTTRLREGPGKLVFLVFSRRVFNPLTFSMWQPRRLVGLKKAVEKRPRQGSVLGGA